jgi:photosystem II stability/assembly factor-like uncharacterized protein
MWQSVASGVEDALRSVFFSGANGISGGDSQTILYSTDSGTSWQISQSGFFGGGFPGAHMLSPTIGFVAGQNSIFQPLVQATTDGGASWEPHAFYFDKNEGGATDVRFLDVNTGVVSGFVFDGRGAIARTTDGGTNWSTLFFDQTIEGVDFPVTNTTNFGFAVGWGGRILHSTDTGIAWTDQVVGPPPISTTFPSPAMHCAGSQLAATPHDPMDRKRRRTGADTNAFSHTDGDSTSYSSRTAASDTRTSPHTLSSVAGSRTVILFGGAARALLRQA